MQRLPTDGFTHLILDLNLDDGSSLDVLPQIIEKYPDLLILIYSMASEEMFGKKLLQFNISGFLSKKSEEGEIIQALKVFFEGGMYVSKNLRKLRNQLPAKQVENNIFESLSMNEFKVLELMLKGAKTKEIAAEFDVAQQTIATYKSRIFKKLGTDNIFEIQKLTELYNINFS